MHGLLQRIEQLSPERRELLALLMQQEQLNLSDIPAESVAPRTPVERALAEIWSQILGVAKIGIDDNYFALGGDSIRSIQVRARARARGINVTIEQLFTHQTIRALAEVIQADAEEAGHDEEVPPFGLIAPDERRTLPAGVQDAYPLALLQTGMLFHNIYTTAASTYHDVFSYHIRAPFELTALTSAICQVLEQHEMLRTSFDLTSYREPLQLVHTYVNAPPHVVDLRELSPEQQETQIADWIDAEKRRAFDLDQPPLLGFYVHRRTDQSFQFTLSFHHAILDGWSVASLLTELFQRYLAQVRGEALSIVPPTTSYRQFIALERQTIGSAAAREFWTTKLRGSTSTRLPRRAELPQAVPAPRTPDWPVPISPELSASLKALARSASVPLKTVLLAAHLWVLRLLSGQTDVLTGVVTNGRPEVHDGERVLGLFLNTLPLRLIVQGGSWIDLMKATAAAELEMMPYRRYPFALIQRQYGDEPLLETLFNLNHFHVYQRLAELTGDAMVIDQYSFEQTNFTLCANFYLTQLNAQVQLVLERDARLLSDEQMARISDYYLQTLTTLVREPFSDYTNYTPMTVQEEERFLSHFNEDLE